MRIRRKKNGEGKEITKEGKNTFLIRLGIKTNARKDRIYRDYGGQLMMKVRAPPTKGKANKSIEKYFKKKLDCDGQIVKGLRSHNKIIKITGFKGTAEDLEEQIIK